MVPGLSRIFDCQWTGMNLEVWIEPFAGGAGAGLGMLENDSVSELWLVEKHPALAAFWDIATCQGDRLARTVERLNPTVISFENAKTTIASILAGDEIDPLQVALDTFIVNRCSRSGIVTPAAGPIGGKDQAGPHKIGDRWNAKALADRIRRVGERGRQGKIKVHHADGIDMIANLVDSGIEDEMFLFVDPPYIREGNRLYHQGLNLDMHHQLSDALSTCPTPWLLTYDNEPAVRRELYPDHRILQYRISNTANRQRRAWEFAVLSHNLNIPSESAPSLLPSDSAEWLEFT